jgi:hypothetical protein
MKQQQQQTPSILLDMRTGFNLAMFAADVHTACIRPITRSGMGTRGMGAPGFWAMLLIPTYAAAADAPEMIRYFWVWLALVVYRRIRADKRQHTQFQGWVWPLDWCVKNELTAHLLEAVSMLLIGSMLTGISEALGMFISAGFVSFGFRYVIDAMVIQRQKEAAHNARVEMQAMQGHFEEVRGR